MPVVVKPLSSFYTCCCFPLPYISIPAGFSATVQSVGGAKKPGSNEDDTWPSGFHCLCPWNSVDRLVSQQTIVFDAPVRECKTKDAVSSQIDVMITFHISNATDFVYQCGGAEKFDEVMRACQDEQIRMMANERRVTEMYDMFSQNTEHIKEALQKKFNEQQCGVTIDTFTIKQVTIEEKMAQDYQATTLVDPLQRRADVELEFQKLQSAHVESRERLKQEKENQQREADAEADVTKQQAERETQELESTNKQKIATVEANTGEDAKKVLSNAQLKVSQLDSTIMSMEQEIKSSTMADTNRISVEAEAYCKKKEVEASIENSAKHATGIKALGEAEGQASEAFAARRAFEAEGARLDILEKLVLKSNLIIATSQENTVGLNPDNAVVTAVAQQGLEALRAKLTEITATSLSKIQSAKGPAQQRM